MVKPKTLALRYAWKDSAAVAIVPPVPFFDHARAGIWLGRPLQIHSVRKHTHIGPYRKFFRNQSHHLFTTTQ